MISIEIQSSESRWPFLSDLIRSIFAAQGIGTDVSQLIVRDAAQAVPRASTGQHISGSATLT